MQVNSHIDRVPQIVREKTGFYNLIQSLSHYIDESSNVLYGIIDKITAIVGSSYSNDIDFNYLRRLVTKCGIKIDYSANLSTDTLKQLYFVAIQGFVVQRLSDGTKANLLKLLHILFDNDNTTITLTDNLNMTYAVTIAGGSYSNVKGFMAFYLKPLITGVSSEWTFNTVGVASTMCCTSYPTEFVPTPSTTPSSDNFAYSCVFMTISSSLEESLAISSTISGSSGMWALELR